MGYILPPESQNTSQNDVFHHIEKMIGLEMTHFPTGRVWTLVYMLCINYMASFHLSLMGKHKSIPCCYSFHNCVLSVHNLMLEVFRNMSNIFALHLEVLSVSESKLSRIYNGKQNL